MIEKGPEDKVHFPEFKKGCYYEREEDCCWLCFIRIRLSLSRQPLSHEDDSTSEHPIIGMSVRIPMVDQSDEMVTHAEGKVINVYQTDDFTDFVTVRLENGSTISLAVKPSLRLG